MIEIIRKLGGIIKKYPLSCVILIVIWVLCFIDVPDTPLNNVRLIDKWTHVVMYLMLGLSLGLESTKKYRKASGIGLAVRVFVFPVAMGGLIEILQANCTGGRRSGDWLDFAADAIGCGLAFVICTLLVRCRAKA